MGSLKVWDGSTWQTLANQGKPGSNVFVGPSTPPGTPTSGDMWYDTDEVSGLTMPITLANGGTGGTNAAAARSSLTVSAIGESATTAGAPTTGTWVRGDRWLDSGNVLWTCTTAGTPGTWMPPIGYELAYNQVTTQFNITSTSQASPSLVVDGTTRTYDGTPVIVEFNLHNIAANGTSAQVYLSLWDGSTDLGYIAGSFCQTSTQLNMPINVKRRFTPSP